MNGLEEIDWEEVIDLTKRFGGLLIAILFAIVARRRKRKDVAEEEHPGEETDSEAAPIEPGTDAVKLAGEFSGEEVNQRSLGSS